MPVGAKIANFLLHITSSNNPEQVGVDLHVRSMATSRRRVEILMPKRPLILASLIVVAACTGVKMKPYYAQSDVSPVTARKLDDGHLIVDYKVFPETRFFSSGLNYQVNGDVLQVFIDRCEVGKECSPMAKSEVPLDSQWKAEVRIPYRGERVVVVHADGEQQIYP